MNDAKRMNNEIWIRRWLAKTAFVFGLALGFTAGFIAAFRSLCQ